MDYGFRRPADCRNYERRLPTDHSSEVSTGDRTADISWNLSSLHGYLNGAGYTSPHAGIGPGKGRGKVKEAVKAKFPDAELVSADKETDKGKVAYEVAIKNKGQKIEVTVSEEGKIISIEKEIAVKDLPKVVAEAFEKKYPKAK